jgi:two-component system sensor histidine kinase BaeS
MTASSRPATTRSQVGRSSIGMRLLLTNLFVVITGMTTTIGVAMTIGPPMIRKLMDRAVIPGAHGNHPYERAFREATAVSVSIALAVSALVTISLSWYFSRRAQASAEALSRAASAVADGRYDIRVASPGLGMEFDSIVAAFNKMAQQLGTVDDTRRQLLADLAHEIKTPVAVLEAYMEALEDGIQQLDDNTMATLRQQTQRLARFSNDVTALAVAERRSTSIDAQWTVPSDLIGAALSAFAPRYTAKGVALISHIPVGAPQLWADPERLGQVLGNLLDNALRHTRAGDEVGLTLSYNDHSVIIAISDSGDGIAPEHLPRLFERFYRVDAARDRQHGGAGIGLSIAKALVEAHDGHIDAHSEGHGTGCTFRLTLPRCDGRENVLPQSIAPRSLTFQA